MDIHNLDKGMCKEGGEWIYMNSNLSHRPHMQRFEGKVTYDGGVFPF